MVLTYAYCDVRIKLAVVSLPFHGKHPPNQTNVKRKLYFLHFRGRFLHSVIGKRIVRFGFPTVNSYVVQVIEVSVHMNLEQWAYPCI